MVKDRMTVTDIARYTQRSRPTIYRVVRSVGFPPRGEDNRWDRDAVMEWLAENRLPADTALIGGVMVRT
jgi:predicted DNA-binding transcriptional regulator AlpA